MAVAAWAAEPTYVALSELSPATLQVGSPITTEGGYAGRIENTLALRGSTILFIMQPGVADKITFTDLTDESALRIQGTVAYAAETKTWYISVTNVVETQSARQRVVSALNDPQETTQKLLEIGEWARQRAKDYRDERLEALAQAAFIKALKLGDLSLKSDDYEGYFKLAEESFKLLQKPSLREYYIREGIDALVMAKGESDPQTWYEAAKRSEQLLPGGTLSDQLLEKGFDVEAGIAQEDIKDPDYYALAAKARQVLGEGEHYDRFIGKGLDAEKQKIAPGDYSALYGLARKAKDMYPGYAGYRSLIWEAIAMEKSSMDIHDAQAWVRLGNRILYFLDDKYQAGLCFKEAVHADATLVEPREKLRELGYVYYRGQWWKSDELAKSDMFQRAQELEDLTAAGKVSIGMSREQLLRAKGNPESISVAGGGWGVTSQWIYREQGKTTYVDVIADTVVSKGETTE
jgi:hypothetical protein